MREFWQRLRNWLRGKPYFVVEWLLDWFFTRYDIGRGGDTYLVRWFVYGQRYGPGYKVFLHHFYRSDSDAALHDHPWDFTSLILFGGY